MTGTTPVPNKLFDWCLKHLQGAELKVLLIIIRHTLGWQDRRSLHGRKEKDWIASSQLTEKSGCSRRAITIAIDMLVKRSLICVHDGNSTPLHNAAARRGKQRLYFSLAPTLLYSVDSPGINPEFLSTESMTYAKSAEGLRKNVTSLAQKMRITK